MRAPTFRATFMTRRITEAALRTAMIFLTRQNRITRLFPAVTTTITDTLTGKLLRLSAISELIITAPILTEALFSAPTEKQFQYSQKDDRNGYLYS